MFEGLFQPMHLLLIFFIALLLLFGPKLLALGKGAGESIRVLKKDGTSGNDAVYPRTLASLFGVESNEVVWQRVFLLLFATWAAFNLPYIASSAPANLLRTFSYPAALILAGLIACRMSQKPTLTALLAALLYALLCSIPRLLHPPAYAASQLPLLLEGTYTFVWSFLWLRFLSFGMLRVHRFWLALGLATATAFVLGDLAEPFILNSHLDLGQALASFDAQRLTTEFIHDLESAAVFAAVLFGGFRVFVHS